MKSGLKDAIAGANTCQKMEEIQREVRYWGKERGFSLPSSELGALRN